MNKIIYCISGLGTNEKIFVNLRVDGYQLKHIAWPSTIKKEPIESYAARLAESIEDDNAILLGVSFGGMLAIEIARQKPVRKLILVSSIKSSDELPRWMKVAGKLKLNKVLPTRSYSFTETIDNRRLGVSTEEEKELVRFFRQAADRLHLEWGINEILNWKNNWIPDNVVHIHGEHDKIFPVKKLKVDYMIKGATHMMVYNRAEDVSKCICEILSKSIK